MDFLRSLNNQLLEETELRNEISDFLTEMKEVESGKVFQLDEIFGMGDKKKEKERELAAKRYAAEKGKSGRVNKNKDAKWSGGVMGEGRLAELVREFGEPKFKDGQPPERPPSMSPEDYKIWIDAFKNKQKEVDLGPAVGPDVNDIIRKNGKLYLVKSSKNLVAIAKNKEGDEIRVKWADLGKPKEVEGKKVFSQH